MSFRKYLTQLQSNRNLIKVSKSISKEYEIAGMLKELEPEPLLFSSVSGSHFPVAGNFFCSKQSIAEYFNLEISQLLPFLTRTLENPTAPQTTHRAACQEVVNEKPDLDALPILRHCEKDGGNYISSGVVIAAHPRYGQNMDFHRMMQISKTRLAVRVVKNRHFDTYLKEVGKMDVAVCVGLPPNVLLAAATSVNLGNDELHIANALEPLQITKAATVDLWIPEQCEFVLEGTITLTDTHPEGPFVDLTETYDIVREQPVLEVHAITHRKDAVWQALLPGGLEHKLLMGMPREPTIFKKVNQVARCLDVNITPGGSSWLHAVVQIDKQSEEDGRAAIYAAFEGHKSCKHVFVVDQDIDIYDPQQVEWAFATRFQGDRNMVIKPQEQGSSLDPSADPETHFTTKIGFDLTKPLKARGKTFDKAFFPKIDPQRFM